MHCVCMLLWLASVLAVRADGLGDNIPEKVRPIPPKGVPVPDAIRRSGVQFRVVEDTDSVRHLVLPARPADELSDLELAVVAGGKGGGGKNGNGTGYG